MMYPWQNFPYQTGNMGPVIAPLPVMPSSLAKHPQMWSKEEVAVWLKWCVEEYSISQIPTDKFNMNGKALCLLVRSDFMERVPDVGDILYNVLQKLINRSSGPMLYQPLPTYPAITSGSSPYCGPTSCSVSAPRRDNTFLVVPGNAPSRSNVPQSRSNYIPILPDLKKALQSRENNAKYPIQVAGYRLSSPPHTVLSPAPSAGSDSGQSDHRSDNASPRPASEGGPEHYPENRLSTTFPDSGMETDTAGTTPHSLPVYHRSPADSINPMWREKNGDCRLLWEFINYLLVHKCYTDYIRWEDPEKLTFRIINPTALAELWGIQKNRTNMTYEKLSRALRYYYKMNIIKKVPGKRLTYQFLRQPKDIKKGQRGARPQTRPTTTQFSYTGNQSEVPVHKDPTLNNGDPYSNDRLYVPNGERIFSEDRILNSERQFKEEPAFRDERTFSNSPSPPSLSSERSSADSVGYNGTAEVVTFPVQDEPEDLSVKVLLQDKMVIKEETMVVKHDENLNFNNAFQYSNILPSVKTVKQESGSGGNHIEIETKS